MEHEEFLRIIGEIVGAMEEAGYDPYEQLIGYLQTGKDYYITRQGGAREKIGALDKGEIKSYIASTR